MQLILALAVIGLLTYAAWTERQQIEDEWTTFLRGLGL
jgi:hypothetical protein